MAGIATGSASPLPAASTAMTGDAPPAGAASSPEAAAGAASPAGSPQPANASNTQPGADAERVSAKRNGEPSGFDALLLASTGEAAAAGRPAEAPTARDATSQPIGTEATAALPDQMLALLGGAFVQAVPEQSAPAAADVPAAVAVAVAAGAAAPAGKPLVANADAGSSPFLPLSSAGGNAIAGPSVPVTTPSAPASADASGALSPTTGDAAPPAPAFPAIATAPTNTVEARVAAMAPMATPVAVPADPQQGFDDGFGARLVWMAEQRLGHAEIRLNPEHLGPIDVRVQVEGTQVSAEFNSAHASVRQAIEASVPRLRELLGQQGLQLGHADVGQRQAGSGQQAREPAADATDSGSPLTGSADTRPLRSRGLVDEYA